MICCHILRLFRPQTPRYDRLKAKLAEYRTIAAAGGWPLIPAGKVMKPGDDNPRVPGLIRMLKITGDLDGTHITADGLYDDALVAAVKRFQLRHGRQDDGVIGPSTLKALQVPIDQRIKQIVLNLERRRWMQDDLGKRYVFVNQADQILKVVDEKDGREKTVHTARVVVGKPYHRTPVFSNTMKFIVINPYWNIPSSIANKEYLPKLRRNPGALARENIRLLSAGGKQVNPLSINWSAIKRIPYRLRQDTGARNALGRIKFMFPNKFNVYIHDTPSKSLFARASRYFSHGCMRLQYPDQLATVLLKEQGWSTKRINNQIASGKRRIVNLKKHIPVHVTYLTSWANKGATCTSGMIFTAGTKYSPRRWGCRIEQLAAGYRREKAISRAPLTDVSRLTCSWLMAARISLGLANAFSYPSSRLLSQLIRSLTVFTAAGSSTVSSLTPVRCGPRRNTKAS